MRINNFKNKPISVAMIVLFFIFLSLFITPKTGSYSRIDLNAKTVTTQSCTCLGVNFAPVVYGGLGHNEWCFGIPLSCKKTVTSYDPEYPCMTKDSKVGVKRTSEVECREVLNN